MNNSGAVRRDYGQLLNDSPGQTQAGLIRPSQYGDFDQNYQAMASVGRSPGSYTADGGETLSDVARAVWGDAGLWYLIASENGLKGTETLLAGTVLRLPNVNTNLHNAAGVHKPYAPGDAIGDVSPTLVDPPQPLKQKPKKKKSGSLFKKILVVIVVVVVSYFTAGVASTWAGSLASTFSGTAATGAAAGTVATVAGNVVAYAAVGAVANAAGQLTGMALGLQDGFNWSAVGKAALTGGLTGGAMVGLEALSTSGSILADTAGFLSGSPYGQAITGNLVNQSVNMALGDQHGFSWQGVAAAVVGVGVTRLAGAGLGLKPEGISTADYLKGQGAAWDGHNPSTARGMATGDAAVRSVVAEGLESALYHRSFEWANVANGFAGNLAGNLSALNTRAKQTTTTAETALNERQTTAQSLSQPAYDSPYPLLDEVVVTPTRDYSDYRLYADIHDLMASYRNGNTLSTDMDPAFQRQGGTVEEWNRMRAEYDRQNPTGQQGPIQLSPIRVHVDADGKFVEYPQGPEAGGMGTEASNAASFHGPARDGYVLPESMAAGHATLEEVRVTASRLGNEPATTSYIWGATADAAAQFDNYYGYGASSAGGVQQLLESASAAVRQFGPENLLFSTAGGATHLPGMPLPLGAVRVSTDLADISRQTGVVLRGASAYAAGTLGKAAAALRPIGKIGNRVSLGSIGFDATTYFMTGESQYLGRAINTAAWTALDLGMTPVISAGIALAATNPVGWAVAAGGAAYYGYRAVDAFTDKNTQWNFMGFEGSKAFNADGWTQEKITQGVRKVQEWRKE